MEPQSISMTKEPVDASRYVKKNLTKLNLVFYSSVLKVFSLNLSEVTLQTYSCETDVYILRVSPTPNSLIPPCAWESYKSQF